MKQFLRKALFLFILFHAIPAYALNSGATATGSIAPGGTSPQSFTGTAGQGILLYGTATYTVVMTITKPDGSAWTTAYNRLSATLPATGTYNITISAPNITDSGPYSLAYLRGSDTVSDGSLTSGLSFSSSLPTNGIASFQITGNAGQGAILYGAASYIPYIFLYNPDGSLYSSYANRAVVTLPTSGTYTVALVGNSNTDSGDYRLDYVRGASGVSNGKLTSGQSYFGTLAANGLVSFKFTGTAGQGMNLYGNASYSPYFYIYNPDGSPYSSYASRAIINSLPSTGDYTAVLVGYNMTDNGLYRADYVRGSADVSQGTLLNGSTRTASLQGNGLQSYKFAGTASNNVSITTNGAYTRYIAVYKPDGSYWTTAANTLFATPLPTSGTYTAVVFGYNTTDTGFNDVTVSTPGGTVTSSTATKVRDNSCNMQGNPINYDVGFKLQKDTDYDIGGLTFSRIYRSDSTWTNNTIGALWRHNYARTLTISSSSASLTDGTGAIVQYTSTGGVWVATDPNNTATLFSSGSNYLYTLQDNTVEKYSSANKLVRISYQGGGGLNLSYNSSGLLSTVANENGRQMTLNYTSSRVSTLVTPDGTYAYRYDLNGNLDRVTKPNTKFTTYHYENGTYVNALTGITDESGIRFASFTYDASGKAYVTQHAGATDNYTMNYTSSSSGSVTSTNPLGKNTTYNFTNIQGVRQVVQVDGAASTNCVASNKYYNYNDKGWLIGQTDWEGNMTRFAYDDRGNITQVIEGFGTPQQIIKNFTFTSTYNLPSTVSEQGKTTAYSYDPYGRVTLVSVTDTGTAQTRTTTYTYYANTTDGSGNLVLGRLNTVDGPRSDTSDVTTYFYDANLNLNKIRNALSQDTQITVRDAAGRPTTILDVNNVATGLVYNSSGLLGTLVYASGTAAAATTSYLYDANNNLKQVTLPNGVITKYSYDNAQRLTQITDGLNNTDTLTLNAAGNVTQEQYKTSGAVLKYTHTQKFDELARLIQDIGASGQIAFTSYDKNSLLNRYKDPNTNVTNYAYDPLLRFMSSTNALSGVTQLQYTSLSAVSSVKDPRTNTTVYTYNAFGDVLSEVSPDRGTIQYTSYDGAGNLKSRTDARNVVTNFTYDALNRMTSVSYPSNASLNATLAYDSAGGIGCGTAPKGHLCFTSDTGRTTYQYNTLNQLTYTSESRGAINFTTTYTYDGAGFLTGIILPSTRTITYTSNAAGQVASVVAKVNGSNVTLASSITYLPFGPLTTMTYGNGKTFTGTYNTDYNPTNFTVPTIYNATYNTDNASNVIQMGSGSYGYDALLRMSSENGTLYTYDAASNRTAKGATSSVIFASSNRVNSVASTTLSYDSSGNTTSYGTSGYTWNAANQLGIVQLSSSTVGTYTYNYLNQRTAKTVSGTTTYYLYGLNGQLYGEYTSAGALVREYVYLNGNPLAQVNSGSPETATYLHTDQLGTPRFGTNQAGTQVWTWNSDAFGNNAPSGSVIVNLRLPGQYYDAESGLFYNWNRYYSPAMGRYITSDPIGLDGGI